MQKELITIWLCGTEVETRIGSVKGIITAVSIRFNRCEYEISYFLNGKHESAWLNESEFTVREAKKVLIGFKPPITSQQPFYTHKDFEEEEDRFRNSH